MRLSRVALIAFLSNATFKDLKYALNIVDINGKPLSIKTPYQVDDYFCSVYQKPKYHYTIML
jgi:hypothetical protein